MTYILAYIYSIANMQLMKCNDVLIKTRGVLIYRIGKISAAITAKFAISKIGLFEIAQMYLPIFLHAPII